MAKFMPGPAVAEVRGSVGGTTFSRNRYGAYMRNRAKPIVKVTDYTTLAKARMITATQAWQNLSANQRISWRQWARGNPIVGSLGQPQQLTGHAAFVGIHIRLAHVLQPPRTDPPPMPAPPPLLTLTVVPNKTLGTCEMTFTPALTAGEVIWFPCCQIASSGITYVENLIRLPEATGGNPVSAYDILGRVEARIGDLVIGHEFFMYAMVMDPVLGLLSGRLRAHATVV